MNRIEKVLVIIAITTMAIIMFGADIVKLPVPKVSAIRLLDVNDVPMVIAEVNDVNAVTIETTVTETKVTKANAGEQLRRATRDYNNAIEEVVKWTAEADARLVILNNLKTSLGM